MYSAQVPDGRPEGEGGHDRGPVEGLPTRSVDAVDRQGLLGSLPGDEHRRQHKCVEGAGDVVGDTETDVEDVSRHRAEHADHDDGEPVCPGDVPVPGVLEHEGEYEGDEPQADGQLGVQPVHRVVGRGLAHGRRQGLHHPEVGRDLRHAQGTALGEPGMEATLGHRDILPSGSLGAMAWRLSARVAGRSGAGPSSSGAPRRGPAPAPGTGPPSGAAAGCGRRCTRRRWAPPPACRSPAPPRARAGGRRRGP